jgi:hypothetical protein
MLRYYLHDGSSALRFRISGELSGPGLADLEQCWRTAAPTLAGRDLIVELRDVTAVSAGGRALLDLWRGSGARFIAASEAQRSLVQSVMGFDFPLLAKGEKGARQAWAPLRLAALLVVAAALLLPSTVRAGDSPADVLARYTASLEQNTNPIGGGAVTLEIDASLPKLKKQGRLQAIRRLVPFDKPEYEPLSWEGDPMIRRQVIARFLTADAQAQSMPASMVAVSPANYKFRYLGAIGAAESPTYVFRITPRHKRTGLIQGELWIDASTGLAIHKSGRLVKRPSAFLRRVEMTQDTDLRQGAPYRRITRLSIETLLAGRAELTVKERAEISAGAILASAPAAE